MDVTDDRPPTDEDELLKRITVRSDIFGGKPIIRDMRFAVEHVLGQLAAGDRAATTSPSASAPGPPTGASRLVCTRLRWSGA